MVVCSGGACSSIGFQLRSAGTGRLMHERDRGVAQSIRVYVCASFRRRPSLFDGLILLFDCLFCLFMILLLFGRSAACALRVSRRTHTVPTHHSGVPTQTGDWKRSDRIERHNRQQTTDRPTDTRPHTTHHTHTPMSGRRVCLLALVCACALLGCSLTATPTSAVPGGAEIPDGNNNNNNTNNTHRTGQTSEYTNTWKEFKSFGSDTNRTALMMPSLMCARDFSSDSSLVIDTLFVVPSLSFQASTMSPLS